MEKNTMVVCIEGKCLKTNIKTNTNYNYIEFNADQEIKKDQDIKMHIFNEDYSQFHKISYLCDGIEYYSNNLSEGEWMFINCDMYDDFLKFKISIRKKNNKIYLYKIKHILSK